MGHKVPGDAVGLTYLLAQQQHNHKLPGRNSSDNAGVETAHTTWCTLECEHAHWPEENMDGSKSCRTFSALYCTALDEHVTKNTPCAVEHGQRRPKPNW